MPRELSSDVLVSIVLRLPPSTRRLTRLVCRHWRDVVDTRTAEMQSRAKLLVGTGEGSAYVVVDDPSISAGSPGRYLWKNNDANARPGPREGTMPMVVGTCNGLICLRDKRKPDAAITLVNPVTGERLSIPPLPSTAGVPERTCLVGWHEAYGFGYHPTAGRYKIVHVDAYAKRGNLQQLKVFTLGESSWRDVATGSLPRCNYSAGIVGVDGTMYWAAKNGKKLMAFDLDRERLSFIKSPPDARSGGWHLTKVRGRLGILYSLSPAEKSSVWVLEDSLTMKEHKWSRLYIVESDIPPYSSPMSCHLTRDVPASIHGEEQSCQIELNHISATQGKRPQLDVNEDKPVEAADSPSDIVPIPFMIWAITSSRTLPKGTPPLPLPLHLPESRLPPHTHVHEDLLLMYILFARRTHEHEALMYIVINYQKGEIESTSAPWVILISSTVEWHGQEDVEPLLDAKDKGLAQAQSS
uniref:Uncharacterized protein n=1 Tax=Aegilops tauschii TaxID=37682 RepID=M8BU81_AEGTA